MTDCDGEREEPLFQLSTLMADYLMLMLLLAPLTAKEFFNHDFE
jgi:hypothetical protein